jgi:hypothetical protein
VPPLSGGASSTAPGVPASGSLLAGATVPSGATLAVTGITPPGSSTPIAPGTGPVALVDPRTGAVTGTLDVKADGSFTFLPAPGYTGPVPTVAITVSSSDGQSTTVPLSLVVSPLLLDASESRSLAAGSGPLTLNVLSGAVAPPGASVSVTGFSLAGSGVVHPAGSATVTLLDPTTNTVTGAVVVQADGTVTFSPAATFAGQVPAITYTVASTGGQVNPSAVSLTVLPGESLACLLEMRGERCRRLAPSCTCRCWRAHTRPALAAERGCCAWLPCVQPPRLRPPCSPCPPSRLPPP